MQWGWRALLTPRAAHNKMPIRMERARAVRPKVQRLGDTDLLVQTVEGVRLNAMARCRVARDAWLAERLVISTSMAI